MLKIISILKNPLYFLVTGRTKDQYITKTDYPRKTNNDFQKGDIFTVCGFTKDQNPICQTIYHLQEDMRRGFTSDKTFFTFDKGTIQKLELKKTYRLVVLDTEGTTAWEQVVLFIDQYCIVG